MHTAFHLLRLAALGWLGVVTTLAARPAAIPDPRTTGTPFLHVWSAEEYGGAPVNWDIVQQPGTELIYVANNFGVLEYDGAAWRLIEMPGEGRARALTVDARGRIWAAGDDIVRIEPDAEGVPRAVSQLTQLAPADRAVGSLVFDAAKSDAVAFASTQNVFVFPLTGPAFSVRPGIDITSLWAANDSFYVALSNGETRRLSGRELVTTDLSLTLPAELRVAPNRIVYSVEANEGEWRIVTNRGLLTAAPGRVHADATALLPVTLIGDSQVTAGTLLAGGGFACATVRDGLLVFDRAGNLRRHIHRAHGLPSNRIDALLEDHEGGLWIAMRSGLGRLQLDSPFAVHGMAQGLEGGPRTLVRHDGRLFVGHNEGLAGSNPDGTFREIPGMRLGTNRLVAHADRLFVTSGALRELLPDGTLRNLVRRSFSPFIASRLEPGRFLGGMSSGVWIAEVDGPDLKVVGQVGQVSGPISHLLGTGDGYVWASSPTGGLWRIDFREGIRVDAPVRAFGEADGLRPARRRDEVVLFELGGDLVLSCAQWLLRYDPVSDRLVPETRIEGIDPTNLGATDVSRDEQGDLWLRFGQPERTIARLAPQGPARWKIAPVPSAPLSGLVGNGLYADLAARTVWVAGQGALVSIALDWEPARRAPPLRAMIRRIQSPDGTDLLDPTRPAAHPLDARRNALSFAFAAPTYSPDYRGQTGTVYRTRLEGLDEGWSEWTPDARRDFTNLPYRNFVFSVQARDLHGRLSDVTSFAFSITPPWWLSPWAAMVYVALGVLGVVAYIRWRTHTLRRRAAALELMVADRTRELHQQNLELARLHKLELDEKISARLAEEKARLEVLRYQLNPHFLFNALNSVCSAIIHEPVAARAMVVRLADFCRLTLHRPGGDDEAAMTIGQELKLLGAYLEIEQARLGDLISVQVQSDPAVQDVRIPPFLLLPLVENAVKYGAASSAEKLSLRLLVRRGPGEAVEFEVANTGQWLEPGAHSAPSHGIGLENLRQRLARYYPGTHEFTIVAENGWVIMRLRLLTPLHEHPRPAH